MEPVTPVTLEGQHVRLEPLGPAHLDGLQAIIEGPRDSFALTPVPRTRTELDAYVAAALDLAPHDRTSRIVYAGFSQGVPMAFRAAVSRRDGAAAVIAVGGDVPPELLSDPSTVFPPVLLLRGSRDVEWYTQAKYNADVAALTAHRAKLETVVYDGAHEWNAAVATAIAAFIRE